MSAKPASNWRLLGEIAAVGLAFLLFSAGFTLLAYHIDAGFTGEAAGAIRADQERLMVPALLALPFAMLATLGAMVWLLSRRGMHVADLGLRLPPSWPRAVLQGIGLAGVVYVVAVAVQGILGGFGYYPRLDDFAALGESFALYLYGVTAIAWVSAALGEELLFRGFLMRNFRDIFGGGKAAWTLAVVLQAGVFGGLHANQGVAGAVPVAVLALVFGIAYLKLGRNLWPLIIAHGLVDTFGFTMLYLGVEEMA